MSGFFCIKRNKKVDYKRRLSRLVINKVKCPWVWCGKNVLYISHETESTKLSAWAQQRHEAFHSGLPHPLLLWDLLHLAKLLHFSVPIPILFLCIIFRDVPFWQESSDLSILNILYQHLQSKNINILHQKPISAEPHWVQGWISPQQIWCCSIWLQWEPVFQFTDWTGCCFVSDINLSVTIESIGSPRHSHALGAL